MKIFVAASYSSQVNYDTGEVNPEYKKWLESELKSIEQLGHEVFCSLRVDDYKINDQDPAAAFKLDEQRIKECDVLLAYIGEKLSVGVQTELGYALGLGKKVIIARGENDKLAYFNQAIVLSGQANELTFPVAEGLAKFL